MIYHTERVLSSFGWGQNRTAMKNVKSKNLTTQPLRLAELKKSFRFRDYDNDGEIFTRDIGPVVRSVKGLKPSEAEIRMMIAEVDRQGRRARSGHMA